MMERMKGRVPGDISYEALRLARTEMTAAFGEGTIAAAQASPSYQGMKWVLSHSHPTVDVCDSLAAHDEGLGRGVYSPGNEPPMPAHPNGIFHIIPTHERPEKFVERLKKWEENPASEPNIEKWYRDVYIKEQPGRTAAQQPAFLRVNKHDQNYDDTSDQRIESDLKLIPAGHRKILEPEGVVIQTGYEVSRYDRKNKVIQVGRNPVPGEVVHEVAHAIETLMDLYRKPRFLEVLSSSIPIEKITAKHLIIDLEHTLPFVRLEHPEITKFISPYQALVYPADIDGTEIFVLAKGKMVFNAKVLGEYFSEGYRVFIENPQKLKAKDETLYEFIFGLVR